MTSVSWSSPARKIGSRPITPIPNEIYLEIFDYVEYDPEKSRVASKRLLSSLALVCRFFCAMALPRIFKSLEFSGPAYSGDNSAPSHASFCRAIIKGQEPAASLARHVNECIFDSWRVNSDETRWVYDGFLGIYSQAIGRMPNIRQVTLSDTEIDRRLFKVVCSLKNLESLTISKCVFGDDVTDSFLRKITPLKIKSFTLSSTSTREHSAKNLSYMVSAECLEHLRSDAWPVTSKLLLGVDQNILVHLDVTGGYCLALYSLLNRSPRLETLLVNDVSDTNIESDEIAANYDSTVLMTSCRNLHTLKCPPSMVDLVAGRPLHTVMVTGVDYRRDPILPMGVTDVALLKKSTTNIRELHIPLHLYFSVSIYEHFQTLEVLSIMYSHMNYLGLKPDTPTTSVHFKKNIANLITHWPPTTSITEFYIDFGLCPSYASFNMDLKLQVDMLDLFVNKHFPNIKIVGFTALVQWRKDPYKLSWSPFVLPEHRSSLVQRLCSTPALISGDHEGFYEDLLSRFRGM